MNRFPVPRLSSLRRFSALTLALALCAFGGVYVASASTLVVSGGGTFRSDAPATAYSAPGGTFSFSFDVDSHPSVSQVAAGNSFQPPLTNLSYVLNGAPTSATGTEVDFYSDAAGGLFLLCLTAKCDATLDLFGPQVYTGSESSPTIVAGSYTPRTGELVDNTGEYFFSSLEPVTISPAAVTPEPSSLLLLGMGMLGAAGMARQRFRR